MAGNILPRSLMSNRMARKGPVLTFRDVNEKLRQVYPWLLPDDLTYEGFIEQIRKEIKNFQNSSDEPALTRYFKNEFIPKMLSQMDYDNLRWGDTWLMQPTKAQEEEIQEHINHYFEYYQQFWEEGALAQSRRLCDHRPGTGGSS